MFYILFMGVIGLLFVAPDLINCQDAMENLELISLLNEIDKEDTIKSNDPYDMFGEKNEDFIDISDSDYKSADINDGSSCTRERKFLNDMKERMALCSQDKKKIEEELKSEKQLNLNLQQKKLKENIIDVKPFYNRLIHHFWINLIGEIHDPVFQPHDFPLILYLKVKLQQSDVAVFKDFSGGKSAYDEIDRFFQHNIINHYIDHDHSSFWHQVQDIFFSVINQFSSSEAWIKLLSSIFVGIGAWCFWLFLRDIQRELKWRRVLIMMVVILFGISCIFHYRHLIKLKDSKRYNFMIKHGGQEIPPECKHKSGSLIQNMKSWIYNDENTCDKYFEYMMTDASDEISPMVVVSETITIFLLSPLEHLGAQMGKFFSHFYANVPWLYLIPATFIMVTFIMVIILGSFGYGIYLPFWFGSIRPASDVPPDLDQLQKIIRESEKKMAENNRNMIDEAKIILLQISEATLNKVREANDNVPYPAVVEASTYILEKKLEEVILKRFNQIQLRNPLVEPITTNDIGRPLNFNVIRDSNTNVPTEDQVDTKLRDREFVSGIEELMEPKSPFLENVKRLVDS